MKARDVSVSVVDFGDEKLYVNVTMILGGHLEREPGTTKIKEGSRKAKAKELKKILEAMDF